MEVRSLKLNEIPIILHEVETENIISEDDSLEKTYWRKSKRQNEEEPEFDVNKFQTSQVNELQSHQVTKFQNIFPTCENGEIFECQENKSNETLDENCGNMLMFTNGTSSCFCRGSNRLKRNSEKILRRGWSKYIR